MYNRPIIPFSENVEPYAWWDDAFTNEEINYLQSIAKNNVEPALVGNSENNNNIRVSEVSWLKDEEKNEIIFEKLSGVVSSLNSQFFKFNLSCFGEPAQLTNYSEHNQGKYDWHQDTGKPYSPCRKLSLVLQLSNPEDYEGGELQLLTGKQEISISKKRGLIAAFPSYTLHRVTPVTKGNRQSMVVWVTGKPFK